VSSFTHMGYPSRVILGAGVIKRLAEEVSRLNKTRVMFCCTKSRLPQAEKIADLLGDKTVGICSDAKIFVPMVAVEKGRAMAAELKADCLVSFGGGTAVGLAKSIALEFDIPIIAIPTTYSGSETTHIQGIIHHDGVRRNNYDLRMLPSVLIYDPELAVALPKDTSLASGLNAIAHSVSSFLGRNANPVTDMFAERGIGEMAAALVKIAQDPANIEARAQAFLGSWLCGSTVISAGTTLHHKMVHVLGGGWDLPHGPTHGIMLPHSTAYVRKVQPDPCRRISRALGNGEQDAPQALYGLLEACGVPCGLRDLGLDREVLNEATDKIMLDQYFCARPYERDEILSRLEEAWRGRPPS